MPILCLLTIFKSKIIMKNILKCVFTSYINRKSVGNEKTITSEGYGVRCCGLFY